MSASSAPALANLRREDYVGIFANAVRNVSVFSFSQVSVKLRGGKDVIDEDYEAELAAQVAHHLP